MKEKVKIKKVTCVLLLICLLFSNMSVFATSIGQSVDIVFIKDCGQHINYRADNGAVGPVITSYVGYYENGQFYPSYCLEVKKPGVGSDLQYPVSVDSAVNNDMVYRVLIRGFGYNSWQDMGMSSEEDAFVATKQAIYSVLDGRDIGRYSARDARGEQIVNKIRELVDFGRNGTLTPYQSVVNVNAISEAGVDNIDSNYISQTFIANAEVSAKNIQIQINESQAPEGTMLVDANNNPKNNFAENEHFKIIVPRKNITKDLNIDFILRADVKTYPALYGTSPNDSLQDYALVADPYTLATAQKTMNYKPVGELEIEKVSNGDSEITGKPGGSGLEKTGFNIKAADGSFEKNLETDSNGKIKLSNLELKKYIITETYASDYYLKGDDTVFEVDLTHDGEVIKVKFENTPVDIEVNVDKDSDKEEAQGNEIVTYTIDNIKNLSNVKLDDFTLTDYLPKEVRIQNLETGTYNEGLKYKITYDTNKRKNIEVTKDLSTKVNNKIDFTKEKLGEGEYITSYTMHFGKVKIGFSNTSKMFVKTKVIEGLEDESTFINDVKVYGHYLEAKAEDEDDVPVKVYENILKIKKVSKEYNQYTDKDAGTSINATLELLDENKKYITTLKVTDKEELIYKYLETGKTYYLKEIFTDPYYTVKDELTEFKFTENGQVVEVVIENDIVNLVVDVEKNGPTQAKQGDIINYDFNHVGNFSNVPLENFVWGDKLPRQVRLQKVMTGTWNEELDYEIQYITNKNTNWKYIGEKYSTAENYEIDFTSLDLEDGEYVTEYRFLFGKVKSGFQEVEKPQVTVKINEDLANNKIFVNKSYVRGTYEETTVEDEDDAHTIVYTPEEPKKEETLPKTGFDY